MHGLVHPFHHVGEAIDVGDIGLVTQPHRKGLKSFQIGRFSDAASLAAVNGELERIRARQVGGGKIRINPEGEALVEPFDEPVVHFDARDKGDY